MTSTSPSSKGFALIASMLLLAMLAVFSVGISYIVQNESQLSGNDMESAQAYYAAAMDKMMVDFNLLHAGSDVPSVAATEALGGTSYEPSFSGVTYSDYSVTVPNTSGIPDVEVRPVSVGSLRGLLATVTPITLTATAEAAGETVKMTRTIELSQIPVFQFGVFSDDDLSYFETPAFDFGGRVHSNGNLFLATGTQDGLIFHSRVSAAGEVIRSELANGKGTEALSLDYAVKIPTAHNGCEGSKPACRALTSTEDSKTGGPTSDDNASWTNLSETTYNGTILSEATGAKALELALSESGGRAIELIRRPRTGESLTSTLYQSRLYNKAQIRVLLNDAVTDLPGGVGVQLAEVAPYWDGTLFGATDTAFATSGRDELVDGYLLVQYRDEDGDYNDVTMEWLNLGIARENPDAILKFQAIHDHEQPDGIPNHDNDADTRKQGKKFYPTNLYDAREGEVRDSVAYANNALGGIINIIELDVGNLQRWLTGTIGTNGADVETLSHNGYLFYFSDRRGMLPNPGGNVVGEYGYEDIINPLVTTGVPNATLDSGEDVNQNATARHARDSRNGSPGPATPSSWSMGRWATCPPNRAAQAASRWAAKTRSMSRETTTPILQASEIPTRRPPSSPTRSPSSPMAGPTGEASSTPTTPPPDTPRRPGTG